MKYMHKSSTQNTDTQATSPKRRPKLLPRKQTVRAVLRWMDKHYLISLMVIGIIGLLICSFLLDIFLLHGESLGPSN